ncbi:hypothetical protein, partial [Vreelandella aquamarina]|uniref:hypothetical protein n=1 Tax=Vreelandella aquamarina TaxID=77097 RepID=UPI001D17D9A2
MLQDAKDRAKWKARLIGWCDDLSDHLARPVVKLAAETLFGILASGSLRQAEIARALKEPCRLHHTQKVGIEPTTFGFGGRFKPHKHRPSLPS